MRGTRSPVADRCFPLEAVRTAGGVGLPSARTTLANPPRGQTTSRLEHAAVLSLSRERDARLSHVGLALLSAFVLTSLARPKCQDSVHSAIEVRVLYLYAHTTTLVHCGGVPEPCMCASVRVGTRLS